MNDVWHCAQLPGPTAVVVCERDDLRRELRELTAQIEQLRTIIEHVRAMHQPTASNTCVKCHHVWPCGTVRILDDTDTGSDVCHHDHLDVCDRCRGRTIDVLPLDGTDTGSDE